LHNFGELGSDWANAMEETALLASGDCGLTDGSQRGDWRLPTLLEWQMTSRASNTLGCVPALTNVSGGGCIPAAPNQFIGFDQVVFWSSVGAREQAVAFVLAFGQGECGPWLPPVCWAFGFGSVAPKDNPETFVWPVREMR
jgi:hypothetical protein